MHLSAAVMAGDMARFPIFARVEPEMHVLAVGNWVWILPGVQTMACVRQLVSKPTHSKSLTTTSKAICRNTGLRKAKYASLT